MQKYKSILILISFILILSACQFVAEPAHQSGDLLMVDDFSKPSAQWDVWKKSDGSTVGFYREGLAFIINSPNTDYISTPRGNYADIQLEVMAENLNGLMNNGFGLVCRYQDDSNYYAFLVSSDGYYGILRVLYGGYAVLNGGQLQYSDAIFRGQNTNHIAATCVGNQLTLYVNNSILAQVEDDVFSDGKIGVIASSFEESGVAILFDNFLAVYR